MKFLSFTIIAFVTIKNVITSESQPMVFLPGLGTLQGKVIQTAWTNRDVYQFVDVKYAESPSGEHRFKPPVPVRPWNGIRDVSEDGLGCPSVLSIDEIVEEAALIDIEDCLSMTITSHNLTAKQPVMVYIHGEYLYEGNNLEGAAEYFLEKDIVLVVPQYRLGPFGFLSTMTSEIPGNAGVLDIILALSWVQHFISNFGGDPNRVTIFGQVGGSAIAHLLTFSPLVPRNLFQQVIYQSGSALMPVFLTDEPAKFAQDIGTKAGCKNGTIDELNHCFMKLNTIDLLKGFLLHTQERVLEGIGNYGGMQFTIGGPSNVLPEHPSLILADGSNYSYPAMGGTPRNVGSRTMKEIFEYDFEAAIPDEIFTADDYINHVISQSIGYDENGLLTSFLTRELFSSDALYNGTFRAMLPGLIDLAGTIIHKNPVLQAIKYNAKFLPQSSFLYSFDYKGFFNRYPDFDEDFDLDTPFTAGVSLTDENIYLFPYPEHVENLNVLDHEMAKRMIDLWTSFATTGVPSVPRMRPPWPPMEGNNGPYIKIDETFSIGRNYFDEFSATVKDEERGISLIRPEIRKIP